MPNKPVSICKDPSISWNGSRTLYRQCQVRHKERGHVWGFSWTRVCQRDAAYLYTFIGELTGREQSIPVCEECAKAILGPPPEPITEWCQVPKNARYQAITLEAWMSKVKHGYAHNLEGSRNILDMDKETGAICLVWVTVIGIEDGL